MLLNTNSFLNIIKKLISWLTESKQEFITVTKLLALFKEIIAVSCDNYKPHINKQRVLNM
jgi:hypothetical protein